MRLIMQVANADRRHVNLAALVAGLCCQVFIADHVHAQTCIRTLARTLLQGPHGDTIEVVNPSLASLGNDVLLVGSGPVQFRPGEVPTRDERLITVRLSAGVATRIAAPSIGGRYLYPKAAMGHDGEVRLMWAESGASAKWPSRDVVSGAERPDALWEARFVGRGWSLPRQVGVYPNMMWHESTPFLSAIGKGVAVAIAYGRTSGPAVDLLRLHGEATSRRTFALSAIPVYTSVLVTEATTILAFVSNVSGAEDRGQNTLFVAESLSHSGTWTPARSIGKSGDLPVFMPSVVEAGKGKEHAFWSQQSTQSADENTLSIRHVKLHTRLGASEVASDLEVGNRITGLRGVGDDEGRLHVVYQSTGPDDRPRAFYATWIEGRGWSMPQPLDTTQVSRDPAITLNARGMPVISYSAFVGMNGMVPKFGTVVLIGTRTQSCAM